MYLCTSIGNRAVVSRLPCAEIAIFIRFLQISRFTAAFANKLPEFRVSQQVKCRICMHNAAILGIEQWCGATMRIRNTDTHAFIRHGVPLFVKAHCVGSSSICWRESLLAHTYVSVFIYVYVCMHGCYVFYAYVTLYDNIMPAWCFTRIGTT